MAGSTTLTEAFMRFGAFEGDCVMRGLLDDEDDVDEPVRRFVIVGAERAELDVWIGGWLACDDFKSDVSNGEGEVVDAVPACCCTSVSDSSAVDF